MVWLDDTHNHFQLQSLTHSYPLHLRVNVTKSVTVQQSVMVTAYVLQEGCLTAYRSTAVAAWDRVRCALMSQSLQHLKNICFPLPVPCEGRRKEQGRNWLIDWLAFTPMCVSVWVYVYHVQEGARRGQKTAGSPAAGVTGSSQLPNIGVRTQTLVL